jgi:hypothetical protein
MFSQKFEDYEGSLSEEIKRLDLEQKTTSKLQKAKIPVAKPIDKILEIPGDLSELPWDKLGDFLMSYESHAGWIDYCMTRRKIDLDAANVLLDYLKNKKMTMMDNSKKLADKKAEIESLMIRYKLEILEIESDVKVLASLLKGTESKAKAISREITVRQNQLNVSGKTRIANGFTTTF